MILTHAEAAEMLRVAPRQVADWFDRGLLRGYRTPQKRERRIPLSQLRKFAASRGLSLDSSLAPAVDVCDGAGI